MSPKLQKVFKAYMKAYKKLEIESGFGIGRELEKTLKMKQPGVAYWMKKLRKLGLATAKNRPTQKAVELFNK